MKKNGQKRLDALHKRQDAPAREWDDVYKQLVGTQTHIPISEAVGFINQFRGVSQDAFKLSRDLMGACVTLLELAGDASASDAEIRAQVVALLGPFVVEDSNAK